MASPRSSERLRQRSQGIRGQKRWMARVVKAEMPVHMAAAAPPLAKSQGKKNVCVNHWGAACTQCPFLKMTHFLNFQGCDYNCLSGTNIELVFTAAMLSQSMLGCLFFKVSTCSYYEFCVSFGSIFIAFVLLCTTRSGKLCKQHYWGE